MRELYVSGMSATETQRVLQSYGFFFLVEHPCCTVWVLLWLLFQTGLAKTPGIDQQCELCFVIVVTLVT